MAEINALLLLASTLLFLGVLATLLTARFNFPLLLVFLAVGMLAGEDGPGGIEFDDYETAFLVGNLALAIILLDGGLRTDLKTFRLAVRPALTLATLGVLLTAGALAAFAWLLGLDGRYALLLGAVVASTDAAAVFGLLRQSGVRLSRRVESTLEVESGANDPMAIFLVLVLVEWLRLDDTPGLSELLTGFAQQFGLGLTGGFAGGWLLARVLARVALVDGLYAIVVASGGVALFAAMNEIGGSGFLAIYVLGLTIANRPTHATERVLRAMDGLAWLSQAGMFLILGLLVTPSRMVRDLAVAIPIAAFLILVARPFAVWVSMLPFRFPPRELGFISWVGLRGAVPIVLALFPVMAGLERSDLIFNVTFAVVLLSLLVQGTTIAAAARVFRVEVPDPVLDVERAPVELPLQTELWQVRIPPGARCNGRSALRFVREHFGPRATCAAVVRAARFLFPDSETSFQPGDVALLIVPAGSGEEIALQFGRTSTAGPLSPLGFFGEFVLEANARCADVAALYGARIDPADAERTLEELLATRLRGPLVVGDRTRLGPVTLSVREMRDGRITHVGLKLGQPET